jgi:hypothetical protein
VLAGVNVLKGLTVNGLADFGNLKFPGVDRNLHRDWSVGVNYDFRPNLVGKIEQHRADTQHQHQRRSARRIPQSAARRQDQLHYRQPRGELLGAFP